MNHNRSDNFLGDATLSYVAQFRDHQKFVQAHLKGTLNDEQPLLPAFFPPSSYWSSDEKDLFFHGLAVYSRFRPDLIAESIKSKTILDVCLYLDILQTASSPSEIHGSFRSSLEPAMEVSSKWIQNEEQIAEALTQFDSCTWIPGSAERETKKENPKNRCICSPPSLLLVDYTGPSPVDHSSHPELKNSFLSHLDCSCLMALEMIVREAQLGEVDSAAVPSSPTPDPFEQPATQGEGLSDLDSPEPPAIASEAPKLDSLKLEAEYRLMKRLYMRRKRAQSTGRSIDMEAVRLPPGRQPRDRKPSKSIPKSHKKKRKIAQPETVVDPEAHHVVSVPNPVEEMDQEDESQNETRGKGGLRRPRTRNRLLKIGVDSQLASNNNLDFFHLSSLAQLMRMYGSLNDLTGSSYGVSISADTIQLLVAILKEFISEVVRGSLISKEQEIRLKDSLKVWKYNQNEITVENVKETLKSMGVVHSSLKDYFAELVEEGSNGISLPDDPSIDTEMGAKDDNNDDGTGDQDEDEDETLNEDNPRNASDASEQSAKPSQARTELWLPQSLRRCLLPKYTRVSENEDDILPDIDEIGLQHELEEEEELDARDLLASREYEAELWVP